MIETGIWGSPSHRNPPGFSCLACAIYLCLPCLSAAPYWLDEPKNLILAPGEDGRLVCRANGNPKPTVQWMVNGEPLQCESSSACSLHPPEAVLVGQMSPKWQEWMAHWWYFQQPSSAGISGVKEGFLIFLREQEDKQPRAHGYVPLLRDFCFSVVFLTFASCSIILECSLEPGHCTSSLKFGFEWLVGLRR